MFVSSYFTASWVVRVVCTTPPEEAARSRKGSRYRCRDALESSQFSGKILTPNPRPNWGKDAPQKPHLPQHQRPSVSCSRRLEQS